MEGWELIGCSGRNVQGGDTEGSTPGAPRDSAFCQCAPILWWDRGNHQGLQLQGLLPLVSVGIVIFLEQLLAVHDRQLKWTLKYKEKLVIPILETEKLQLERNSWVIYFILMC